MVSGSDTTQWLRLWGLISLCGALILNVNLYFALEGALLSDFFLFSLFFFCYFRCRRRNHSLSSLCIFTSPDAPRVSVLSIISLSSSSSFFTTPFNTSDPLAQHYTTRQHIKSTMDSEQKYNIDAIFPTAVKAVLRILDHHDIATCMIRELACNYYNVPDFIHVRLNFPNRLFFL